MSLLQIVFHFLLGFVTSFLGSIPLGSINAGVARISITRNFSAAIRFIAGVTLAELFYSFIAIQFSGFLLSISRLEFYIRIICIPVFILLGLSYFFSKAKTQDKVTGSLKTDLFLQGLSIGFLNPLQIPFWLAYGSYFLSLSWIIDDFTYLNIFILGIVSGSVTLLIIIAKLSSHYGGKANLKDGLVNKITGGVFICLAFYQLINLFF
jgi:threonine/homoserine/homoserine lactone efflux protein